MPLKLNFDNHLRMSFEEDVDPRSKSCSVDQLAREQRKLIEICCQKLLYAQELQKRVNDKGVKSHNYALGKKVWLNSKYIKTKKNKKLKSKFF